MIKQNGVAGLLVEDGCFLILNLWVIPMYAIPKDDQETVEWRCRWGSPVHVVKTFFAVFKIGYFIYFLLFYFLI